MAISATVTPQAPFLTTRIDTYALLAALLNQAPDPDMLVRIQQLEWPALLPARLIDAWVDLRNAARTCPADLIQNEFNSLFIGLGQGEVIPYASWYLEGFLVARPLARLRQDLARIGIVRRPEVHEPEDHAGLLCQTMALLAGRSDIPVSTYARFFDEHVASWMLDFFTDVQKAPHAGFYRSVGALGFCFLELERAFLNGHGAAAA